MSILLFIIIIGVLISVHELGHFVLAKMNGIRVLEFTIGMGPRLVHVRKGETIYSLRLFPIGGACMFDGEDGKTEEGTEADEHSFPNANVWARIATVIAGPMCNFILAYLVALIMVTMSPTDIPVIVSTMEDFPAQEAGVLPGDEIISVNGERVYLYREVALESQLNNGGTMELEVNRDGELLKFELTPKYSEENGSYLMGFSGGEVVSSEGLEVFEHAYYEVRLAAKSIYKSLLLMVQGQVSSNDMAGVVGIASIVDETYQAASQVGLSSVVVSMLSLTVILSVNLGIVNLLPIPALDGGRLIFLLIEVVRGKPIPPEKEGYIHAIGFMFLMALMVFLLFNDIRNLFGG